MSQQSSSSSSKPGKAVPRIILAGGTPVLQKQQVEALSAAFGVVHVDGAALDTSKLAQRLSQNDCLEKGWLLTSASAAAANPALLPDLLVVLDKSTLRLEPIFQLEPHRVIEIDAASMPKELVSQVLIDAIPEALLAKGVEEVPISPSSSSTVSQTVATSHPPRIIIAGPPAGGKGTQCEMIKAKFGLVHLSTGDILRENVKASTPLGVQAKSFMEAGALVPDELITKVVCDRLAASDCVEKGWLLDGFPRTKAQADALTAAGFVPDCFVLLDVPESILVERVTGRRTDPVTGKIYHLKFNPPENEEVATRLVQRSDDTAEKIIVRVKEFNSHVDSIRNTYLDRTIRIDGSLNKNLVTEVVLDSVGEAMEAARRGSNGGQATKNMRSRL